MLFRSTAIFTADDAVETIGSVSVAADSYSDAAGNNGGAGTDTVTIDTLNPTLAVDIVNASLNDGTNSSLVSFEFSEDVAGFDNSDVNVSGGTLSDFTLVDGNSYTAIFTADDAVETTGSVSVAAASYTDVAGNTGGAGTDTVTIDTLNPTLAVDIVNASLNDGTNSSLVSFEFSEDVAGFDNSDVSVSGGTLSNFTSVDGDTYTATFTASDGVETTGSVSVAAASYTDIAGNNGGAGSDTVTIDTKNPTVGINFASQPLTGQNFSTTVTFQFSEAVSGFAELEGDPDQRGAEQLHRQRQQLHRHVHRHQLPVANGNSGGVQRLFRYPWQPGCCQFGQHRHDRGRRS